MKEFVNQMLQEQADLIHLISKGEQMLANLPEGSLQQDKQASCYIYRHYLPEQNGSFRKYLSKKKDRKLIRALAQKGYLLQFLSEAKSQLELITSFLNTYDADRLADIYTSLSEGRKPYVTPLTYDPDLYVQKWLSQKYELFPIPNDQEQYQTARGEIVRSKSERMIANHYYERGIPYLYEYPLVLGGRTFRPDFTLLNKRTGKQYYHEHLGLISNPVYVERNVSKIRTFAQNGIYIGENLIITTEIGAQTLNTRDLDVYIDHYLL